MAWTSYRDVANRFSHIDGRLVRSRCDFVPGGESVVEVVVRFYPWWEHPLQVEAYAQRRDGSFHDCVSGERDIVVRAIRPRRASLSGHMDVGGWDFTSEHPLLWEEQGSTTLFVNGACARDALIDALLTRRLPYAQRADISRHIDGDLSQPPRALTVPIPLATKVVEILEEMNVPTFCPAVPSPRAHPVLFLMDDANYVIADDFEIDVPEFAHDPMWFRPRDSRS